MEAADIDTALAQLHEWKMVPVDVREEVAPYDPLKALMYRLNARKPGLNELILFSRQMYSLLHAGVPVIQSLSRLRDSTANERFRDVLHDIIGALDSGNVVASIFSRNSDIFSPLFLWKTGQAVVL